MTIQEIADRAMVDIAKYPTDMEFIRAVIERAVADGMKTGVEQALEIYRSVRPA